MKDVKYVKQNSQDLMKEIREQLGWSQTKLARKLGVRQQTISEWECGKSYPREIIIGLKLGLILLREGYTPENILVSLPEDC